jgi:hypothetical protein
LEVSVNPAPHFVAWDSRGLPYLSSPLWVERASHSSRHTSERNNDLQQVFTIIIVVVLTINPLIL